MDLCREKGPLRAVLARIAFRLVWLRAWERLGYARLSDYAVECLGLSARWVRSLAMVGARLDDAPLLEHALVSGELGWTRARLLARLSTVRRRVGRAPDGLRWEMGLRDGVSPRLAYRSGDVEVEVSPGA